MKKKWVEVIKNLKKVLLKTVFLRKKSFSMNVRKMVKLLDYWNWTVDL